MPRETLLALANDVTRLLAAGAQQAPGDDGLRRRADNLRKLSSQIPALVPIADAADQVLNAAPKQASTALLDLALIARQARSSLVSSGIAGELKPLKADGEWKTPAPVKSAESIRDLLQGRQASQRLENLREALERGDLADLRLVQPMIRALADGHSALAEFLATEALPRLGRGVLPLVEAGFNIQGKALDGRRLLAICHLDRDRGRELCHLALKEGSGPVRVKALECLGLVDPKSVERSAMQFLQDPKSEVRAAACIALASVPKDEVLDAMVSLVDDTKEVWSSVLKCLEKFAHPETTTRLIAELQQATAAWSAVKDEPKKKSATKTKAAAKKPAKSAAQRERERWQQRMSRFMDAIGCRPDAEQAVNELVELSQHKLVDIRDGAILVLGVIGGRSPKVVPALVAALKDKTQAVVLSAIAALGKAAATNSDAIEPLFKLAGDTKAKLDIRTQAIRALGQSKTHDPRVVEFLAKALTDKQVRIREAAAEALGSLGPNAVAALPALIEAMHDPKIVFDVLQAIPAIDPEGQTAKPLLLEIVRNPREKDYFRETAFDAVISFKDRELPLEILRELLNEKKTPLFGTVLRQIQLQRASTASLLPDLLDAVRRGENFDYQAHIFCFLEPHGETVIPAATELLSSKSKDVRETALWVIRAYGRKAKASTAAVEALLKDKDRNIRSLAQQTFNEIR